MLTLKTYAFKGNFLKFILSFFLIVSFSLSSEDFYRLGLGSCHDQDMETPAWESLEKENLDSFFFLGDNVYGDLPSGELRRLINAYDTFKQNKPQWFNEVEIFTIWDDHDYGMNDGGGDYKYKTESQKLFNDFWNISQNDPRRKREGIYFSELRDINNLQVLIIGLDTRYFRSNLDKKNGAYLQNKSVEATILGEQQWTWLQKQVEVEHDLLIIATSIQVLATEHRFEKWSNFPNEREKLLNLLNSLDSNVLIISGDRHRSGVYQKNEIYEFTSSSLNVGIFPQSETDTLLKGRTYPENNYGIIDIYPTKLEISIKNQNMSVLENYIIPIK